MTQSMFCVTIRGKYENNKTNNNNNKRKERSKINQHKNTQFIVTFTCCECLSICGKVINTIQ